MPPTCVRAPNPGPMTLEGTNTYLFVGSDGRTVVVDPGPADPAHLAELRRQGPIGLVLLTHGHDDHAEAAPALAEEFGAPIRALDPGRCLRGDVLRDGELIPLDQGELRVLATPGHTFDSVCFEWSAAQALLSGDTVLGRGPSVIAFPDGGLRAYFTSLDRLAELARERIELILPGHGPQVRPALATIEALAHHRRERLAQVRAALADGVREPGQVVALIYRDVSRELWPAAELSVRAQLAYLDAGG